MTGSAMRDDDGEQVVNDAVGERWRRLDPLLPGATQVAAGCGVTFRTPGGDGFAVCRHLVTSAGSLDQTWSAATTYLLAPRLAVPDVSGGLDQLLAQWREHVSVMPEAAAQDTAVQLRWPTRDTTGVRALLRHGLAPMTVIAARPAKRASGPAAAGNAVGLNLRRAGPGDLELAVRFQLDVIRYDEQFGVGQVRPATEALVSASLLTELSRRPSWIWLAERERTGEPVGLLILQPPEQAGWIAALVSAGPVAYLATMFVQPGERGAGVGAALVGQAHAAIDDHGAAVTLLHYAQVNPVSGPFWSRMGYRPLWTIWGTSPAAAIR